MRIPMIYFLFNIESKVKLILFIIVVLLYCPEFLYLIDARLSLANTFSYLLRRSRLSSFEIYAFMFLWCIWQYLSAENNLFHKGKIKKQTMKMLWRFHIFRVSKPKCTCRSLYQTLCLFIVSSQIAGSFNSVSDSKHFDVWLKVLETFSICISMKTHPIASEWLFLGV